MNTKRRNARGEVTLKTILEETASLMGRYGYDGTTIARITQVTGKPASSMYWFFDTKDELLAAALESTYRGQPEDIPVWPKFDADKDLEQQLYRGLGADFDSNETEDPVRLGIMVALEGNAAGSLAQEPFLLRRRLARGHISEWWGSALAAQRCPSRTDVGEWMTLLTLAFLDGHYISDVVPDAVPKPQRGQMVAKALAAAFRYLILRGETFPRPSQNRTDGDEGHRTAAPGGVDTLLSSTRSCVAERGYEGATLTEICKRSGIQRSSIYWRYKSKDELIRAAVAEPFLALVSSSRPGTVPVAEAWHSQLAASVERCAVAAMESPDTVKAGLLLKLHRRDPPSLGSQAIQRGLALEAEALGAWIDSAVGVSGSAVEADQLAWAVNVLTEGLLLGVAFGQYYDRPSVSELTGAMIDGMLTPASYASRPSVA